MSQHRRQELYWGGGTVLPRQIRIFPVWCLPREVKSPSRVSGLGDHTAPDRAPSPPPPAVAHPAPSAFYFGSSASSLRYSSSPRGPASGTMELRMSVGYPGAVVDGGDAIDGPGFFGLNATQQAALFTFWTAPGEFLVRVTHVAFGAWLVPAGIHFADPTAAGHSCAASHVLKGSSVSRRMHTGPGGHRRHGRGPVRGNVRHTAHACGCAGTLHCRTRCQQTRALATASSMRASPHCSPRLRLSNSPSIEAFGDNAPITYSLVFFL